MTLRREHVLFSKFCELERRINELGHVMIEVAVRISQLVSSNVNNLVDAASNPVKMLRLLIVEIEEAILTLRREVSQSERRARDLRVEALRHEAVQANWNEKARFALSKDREDLARGALTEREAAANAASAANAAADQLDSDLAGVRETLGALDARLSEARQRLTIAQAASPAQPTAKSAHGGTSAYSERVLDRIDTIAGRADFAEAAKPAANAKALDEELAELAREERITGELEALRKSLKKKRA